MLTERHPSRPQGFALWELAAAIAVVAILAAMAAVSLSESRRQASLGDNFANLKQFAIGTSAYAADNDDRMWGFSWEPFVQYTPDIPPAFSYIDAHAYQAIHIIRTRGNRPDFPLHPNWIANFLYSHLTLIDYLEAPLPARFVASPEDRLRLLWQVDPIHVYPTLPPNQRPESPGLGGDLPPYSSSYDVPPAFWSPDAGASRLLTAEHIYGGSHHDYIIGSDTPLGGRRLHEIAFPAQKVMLFEQYQRHFGPRIAYFIYPEARIPLLLSDGSAAVRLTADANEGFQPNRPTVAQPMRIRYRPLLYEPPTLNGQAESEALPVRYRFTRSGLRGRDFDGPEVPWVP